MDRYVELRNQFKTFRYIGYDISEEMGAIKVVYHFSIDGLSTFAPGWKFPMGGHTIEELKKDKTFINMVFSLGMVELISYWKISCPKRVIVEAGFLNDEQIEWWKELYYLGLGEFFYTNGIVTSKQAFMDIELGENVGDTCEEEMVTGVGSRISEDSVLVPIGGGKDSVVSLELLKKTNDNIKCYIINPRGATLNTVATAGMTDNLLVANRTLDKNMIELNKQGYLNGHTPYSAIVAFSSTIVAYIHGLKYIALSNEDSANESTVKGTDVNHQYSKSFKFEQDFHNYEEKFIGSGTYYFSLLRPLSEFQIASYFAKCKEYHQIFRSCNVGSKEDIWCGHCPKCMFVYIILSPFIEQSKLREIFGADMLDDDDMKDNLHKLIGYVEEKPFECVGSRDEVNSALCMTINRIEENGDELPLLLDYYKTTDIYKEYSVKEITLLKGFSNENLLPEKYRELVYNEVVGLQK